MGRWPVLLLLAWPGCADDPPDRAPVAVAVTVDDGDGAPVRGAEIAADGAGLATTDGSGRALLELPARAERALQLSVACPAGSAPDPPGARWSVPLGLRPLAADTARPRRQQVAFSCRPRARAHLLVVRTDGRVGLPVRITGRPAISTDAVGVALAVLRGAIDEEIEVLIDTSGAPELRPANPNRRLRLPATGRFLIFDQVFSERRSPRARRRPPRGSAVPRRL